MKRRGKKIAETSLPFGQPAEAYAPRAVRLFQPKRIILARGSLDVGAERRTRAICGVYPEVIVIERLDRSHVDVDLGEFASDGDNSPAVDPPTADPLVRHLTGKRTLVIGEHKSAVRFSQEEANCCPNYWHFSPYGFCPYGCAYCYLAGTRGVWFSPAVKVFVNIEEMLAKIDQIATRAGEPTPFYLGKLQDGLALDPLTGYSRLLVPFFAEHRWARLIVLTKSADVANLLDLRPAGNTVLSWSLTSEATWRQFEPGTPSPAERLTAMKRCADAGYRVRAVIMPILPVSGWANGHDETDGYVKLLDDLLTVVPVERITLGSLCSFPNALRLTDAKLGRDNPIRQLLRGGGQFGGHSGGQSADGRHRFAAPIRTACYRTLIDVIRSHRPDVSIGLCLEEQSIFVALGLSASIGRCNCVL